MFRVEPFGKAVLRIPTAVVRQREMEIPWRALKTRSMEEDVERPAPRVKAEKSCGELVYLNVL